MHTSSSLVYKLLRRVIRRWVYAQLLALDCTPVELSFLLQYLQFFPDEAVFTALVERLGGVFRRVRRLPTGTVT